MIVGRPRSSSWSGRKPATLPVTLASRADFIASRPADYASGSRTDTPLQPCSYEIVSLRYPANLSDLAEIMHGVVPEKALEVRRLDTLDELDGIADIAAALERLKDRGFWMSPCGKTVVRALPGNLSAAN